MRPAPRNVCAVRAAVSRIAVTGRHSWLTAELQTVKPRRAVEVCSGRLIHADSNADIASRSLGRVRASEKARRTTRVIASAITQCFGIAMTEIAQHRVLASVVSECSSGRAGPRRNIHAVWKKYEHHPRGRHCQRGPGCRRRGACPQTSAGQHCLKHGKCNHCPRGAQHGSSGDRPRPASHWAPRNRKDGLSTIACTMSVSVG